MEIKDLEKVISYDRIYSSIDEIKKLLLDLGIKEENIQFEFPNMLVKYFYKNRTLCIETRELDIKSHNCVVYKIYYTPTLMRSIKT